MKVYTHYYNRDRNGVRYVGDPVPGEPCGPMGLPACYEKKHAAREAPHPLSPTSHGDRSVPRVRWFTIPG